jgi:hypothetical protein
MGGILTVFDGIKVSAQYLIRSGGAANMLGNLITSLTFVMISSKDVNRQLTVQIKRD